MHKLLMPLTKLSKPMRRYLVIGVSVYLFELLIIFTAKRLGASDLFAVGLSFWIGIFFSFGLQKLVTFENKQLHHRILIPQIIAFSILVLANFGFTLLLTHLLTGIVPPALSRTLALGMTTIWNFYLYKTRIFKTDAPTVY